MRHKLSLVLHAALLVAITGCHSNTGADAQKESPRQGNAPAEASDKASVPADLVRIAREDQSRAGIQVAPVVVKSMPQTLNVSGQVAMDERHTNHIGALADGRVDSVFVLPGDTVRKGQTLATIHSHTVHETVAALTQAFAAVSRQQSAVNFATQARDRYAKLYGLQAASLEEKQRSEQEMAQAQKDLIDADAMMRAEREHLAEILQVSPDSLQPGTLYQRELVPVRAIADGVVISRNVTPGQVITTGDEIITTSNLSAVWVNAAVNEKDVPQMKIGSTATVTAQTSGTVSLQGTVTMLGDVVDPQTRTLPVRISVANPGTRLRPGMFVTAGIAEPATQNTIFVPQNALQDVNGFRVVFTTKDGSTFRASPVKTGLESGDLIEITDGLKPGDRIVVKGAFMVKGELLKGTVGEG